MRIDAHQHFWQFDPVRDSWIDESMGVIRKDFMPSDLQPIIDEHQIDGTIAVQADQSEAETEFLLKLADQYPFIKGVVGWVDLRAHDIDEKLSKYSGRQKLCGFRHIVQSEPDDLFMLRDDFLNGVKALDHFGFAYDILIYTHQLPAAIDVVNKLPEQKFVLDHLAKPKIKSGEIEPWKIQLRELASAPNVYCKISGMITEADHRHWMPDDIKPYLDVVFDSFDINKIMFGSDWPVCLLSGSYNQVVQLVEDYIDNQGIKGKDQIFGGNAIEFYGFRFKK